VEETECGTVAKTKLAKKRKAPRAENVIPLSLPGNPAVIPDLGSSPILSNYAKRKLEKKEDALEFNRVKSWYTKYDENTIVTIKKRSDYANINMNEIPSLIVQLVNLYKHNNNYSTDYLNNALDLAKKMVNPQYIEIESGSALDFAGNLVPKFMIDNKIHARIDYELPNDLDKELQKERDSPEIIPYISK